MNAYYYYWIILAWTKEAGGVWCNWNLLDRHHCVSHSLVIKDLAYEAKAKAKTFFLKAKTKAKDMENFFTPRPRLFSEGQGQGQDLRCQG